MTCKRNFTKEEILEGLKQGKILIIDRIDAPELEDLFDLQEKGLIESQFVEYDKQSSGIEFRWKNDSNRKIN